MKQKVFVTRIIPAPAIALLKKHFQVQVYQKDQVIPRMELIKGVKWCDALLCLLTDKIDAEIIEANPRLKIISNYAVGVDNIDLKQATMKKIPVCNTPSQQIVDAVAEHTMALLLALAKRLHEGEELVRNDQWKAWDPNLLLGRQIAGKTLGVVGLGRIGSGVTERAVNGLGMRVIYYDIVRNKQFEKKYRARYVSLAALLKSSDAVTIHVSLSKSTYHLIGAKELRLMKKTAYLINTSRGSVVDEVALVSALRNMQLAGAGLDVYEQEPNQNHPLHALHNCILTPHVASATLEVREQMSKDAAESIIAVLNGRKSQKTVNPEVYGGRKVK